MDKGVLSSECVRETIGCLQSTIMRPDAVSDWMLLVARFRAYRDMFFQLFKIYPNLPPVRNEV